MRGGKFDIVNIEKQLVNCLKKDVDSLAKQFSDVASTELEKFAELFKAKEFSTIFLGRLAITELAEFVENLLLHCARYMVTDTATFSLTPAIDSTASYPDYVVSRYQPNKGYELSQLRLRANRTTNQRIFGLYMCYCLYFLQPANYVVPIRLSVRQMCSLHHFARDVLLVEEHFEALFCLFRLLDGGAFSITPFEVEFNPLLMRRFDGYDEESSTSVELAELDASEDFSLLTQLSEDVTFKQLSAIHDAYKRMKDECNVASITGLGVATSIDLSEYVKNLLAETKTAFAEQQSATNATAGKDLNAESTAQTSRQKIRHSAYTNVATSSYQSRRRQRQDSSTPVSSAVQSDENVNATPSKPSTSKQADGVLHEKPRRKSRRKAPLSAQTSSTELVSHKTIETEKLLHQGDP